MCSLLFISDSCKQLKTLEGRIWFPAYVSKNKKDPKNQHPSEEMSTWIKERIRKERATNGKQIYKEVFKFPGYKRDANQNNT
jgi:hypothetical protein